ncbi:hypothetical protein PV327_008711 [Microctonus hyperodae]|uniref:Uncharacterized protein n=1 Tax=Microctonus hyperodae TaxID=165561 RepID=A0AA39F3Q4_MICHY|nr:hypothetical protein PV327_008711 [Microctonus hyperodae]
MGFICLTYCYLVLSFGYHSEFCEQSEQLEPKTEYKWVEFEPQMTNDTRLVLLNQLDDSRFVVGRISVNKKKL